MPIRTTARQSGQVFNEKKPLALEITRNTGIFTLNNCNLKCALLRTKFGMHPTKRRLLRPLVEIHSAIFRILTPWHPAQHRSTRPLVNCAAPLLSARCYNLLLDRELRSAAATAPLLFAARDGLGRAMRFDTLNCVANITTVEYADELVPRNSLIR